MNTGYREAAILSCLSQYGPLDAAGLASRVIHQSAKTREIVPTLVSMARRKLLVRVVRGGLRSPLVLWCLPPLHGTEDEQPKAEKAEKAEKPKKPSWRTSEDLLGELLAAVQHLVDDAGDGPGCSHGARLSCSCYLVGQDTVDGLKVALAAYKAGPKVPPGHCEDCGQLGEQDGPREQYLVCHTIDCNNYHGGCEEGQHPEDCQLCKELEARGEA